MLPKQGTWAGFNPGTPRKEKPLIQKTCPIKNLVDSCRKLYGSDVLYYGQIVLPTRNVIGPKYFFVAKSLKTTAYISHKRRKKADLTPRLMELQVEDAKTSLPPYSLKRSPVNHHLWYFRLYEVQMALLGLHMKRYYLTWQISKILHLA